MESQHSYSAGLVSSCRYRISVNHVFSNAIFYQSLSLLLGMQRYRSHLHCFDRLLRGQCEKIFTSSFYHLRSTCFCGVSRGSNCTDMLRLLYSSGGYRLFRPDLLAGEMPTDNEPDTVRSGILLYHCCVRCSL